jgi:cyclophilin family peptidyl-prolyl cis-trans isomerase
MRHTRAEVWAALAAAAGIAIGCGGAGGGGELRIVGEDGEAAPIALIDLAEDARRVTPELLDLADHPDASIRERVAVALGRIGGSAAIDAIVALGTDGDVRVREAGLFALGLQGEDAPDDQRQRLSGLIKTDAGEGEIMAALDALGRIGDAGIAGDLIALSDDKRPAIRAAAIRALGFLGQRGVPVLDDVVVRIADRLGDGDEAVRFMAAFALYRIAEPLPGPPEALTELRKAAADDDSAEVRAYSVRGLARRGGLGLEQIERALTDSDPRVGGTAVSVVPLTPEAGRCELASAAVNALAARVEEEPRLADGELAHAIRAALEVAEPCAAQMEQIPKLAQRIAAAVSQLEPPRTAGAARILCLARLVGGDDDLKLLACDPERPHAGKRMFIRRIGRGTETSGEHVERLVELLAEPDLRVVTSAAYTLGEIPQDRSRGALLGALADDRSLVAAAVLDAITFNPDTFRAKGGEGDARPARDGVLDAIAAAVDRLLPFDHAEAPLVSAAAALGALGDPAAGPILEQLATDPRPAVRGVVLKAYEAIDGLEPPEVLPPLSPPRPVTTIEKQELRALAAVARVRTTRGDFRVRLRSDVAPGTVGSFLSLAKSGYFDGSEIHRVVPNFVVQAGDPTGTGMGDPGYSLRCEASPLPYRRGTVGMALAGKDTGGSQFFVAISRQPHLDGNYTVFGDVIEGLEVVDLIEEGDEITTISVTVEEAR